jgi:hypothetical protein
MIIDNFDFGALSIAPAKADTPLIVYADAMLTRAFALQPFQAIRRWNSQIIKALRGVKHPQLPTRESLNLVWQAARNVAMPDAFSLLIGEAPNHV